MTDDSLEQKKQELSRRVMDKIANDPVFREQLATDPAAALQGSEFWDAFQELSESGKEVAGYIADDFSYCCISAVVY